MSDSDVPDDASGAAVDGTDGEPTGGEPEETVENLGSQVKSWILSYDPLIVGATLVFVYGLFAVLVVLQVGVSTDAINPIADAWRQITYLFAAYGILALALNLHWGYTGIFNIGIAGFMAVGVYVMAFLSTPTDAISGQGLGLPIPIGVLGGVIAAGLVGLIAALPALRLRADYLAIVTLGLSEIIRLTAASRALSEWLRETFGFATGGGSGTDLPDRPTDALFETSAGDWLVDLFVIQRGGEELVLVRSSVVERFVWAFVVIGFMLGVYWLLTRIGYSPFGRVLKAIREDELVAKSLGKDTRGFKIKVFILGCALMGLGGILWQGSQGFVNPNSFRPIVTFYVFIALIIGGSGSNTGSIVGAILFVGLLFLAPRRVGAVVNARLELSDAPGTFAGVAEALANFDILPALAYTVDNIANLQFVLLGVVLVVIVQKRPEGLLGHRTETASPVDLGRSKQGGPENE